MRQAVSRSVEQHPVLVYSVARMALFIAALIPLRLFGVRGLWLFFSGTLDKDAREGRDDAIMLKVGRMLAIVLLVGMIIAMAGLLIDGKMSRFLNPRHTDWPANNIFFFGAMAMAMIAGYAIRHKSS